MIRNLFTNETLPKYFKGSMILYVVCLLAIIIQIIYAPNYIFLEQIIDVISNLNLLFIVVIVIAKILLLTTMHHKKFISKYKFIIMMFNFLITMIVLWLFVIHHHIEKDVIEFYSQVSTTSSHYNMTTIIIFSLILMILLSDLYTVIEEHNKENFTSIKSITWTILYILIKQYIIIGLSLLGFVDLKLLHSFITSTTHSIYVMSLLYFHLFIYIFIISSTIVAGYYIYNHFFNIKKF